VGVGRGVRLLRSVVTLALMAGICAGLEPSDARAAGAALRGSGSVEEAWLTGAHPADRLVLLQGGKPVPNAANPGSADALGALIIRSLQPGAGYSWRDETTGQQTQTFAVLAPGRNPPVNDPLYTNQSMHEGLNYIVMRDGIVLAATVRFPLGVRCSSARPCPTVAEYSGYDVAGPTDPIPPLLDGALGAPCTACGDRNLLPDSSTDVGSVVARVSGFATVSLQMRGTGCSGGAFDLFGYPSDYDAYDAIEIVSHQPWVAHHKVGLVGISFSGLSQFPAAGTDPPGLAAIAPMSPTDDLFSTGYPGGMYNDGFAAEWIASRIDDAKPAATLLDGSMTRRAALPVFNVGQPWTYYEIDAELARSHGVSSQCLSNQALHDQSLDLERLVGARMVAPHGDPDRDPALFNRRSMVAWAAHVHVPVFLSIALQDEQTGPQAAGLISAIPKGVPLFANLVNGDHIDSADPQTMSRWLEFLDLYVADEVPRQPNALDVLVLDKFAPTAAGVTEEAALPALRFTHARDVAAARSAFAHRTPRVRVLFDNGAGAAGPGGMESTYSAGFSAWPPAGTTTTLYLGSAGVLQTRRPAAASSTFSLNPGARPRTSLPAGGNVWVSSPHWDWTPVPASDGLGFQTTPFSQPISIVGPATLRLWVRAPAPVEDFQATVTEVRPAARQEEYVTSGFLRSTNQVDSMSSTALFTDPTYRSSEEKDLSSRRYALLTMPLDPIVHTFRPGTELRIVVSAPGGDRPVWTFDTVDAGQPATVGFGGAAASTLTVNVVPHVGSTTTAPACGALRGEPCRPYSAEGNQM
jgi:uncharacterized protein